MTHVLLAFALVIIIILVVILRGQGFEIGMRIWLRRPKDDKDE